MLNSTAEGSCTLALAISKSIVTNFANGSIALLNSSACDGSTGSLALFDSKVQHSNCSIAMHQSTAMNYGIAMYNSTNKKSDGSDAADSVALMKTKTINDNSIRMVT